jgi:carboxyl-terminal processing protease
MKPKPFYRVILVVLLLAVSVTPPALGAPEKNYESLRLITEAFYEISQKFVSPKSEDDMIYGALRGMMNSLDPDSSFLTPQEYQNYLSGQKGQGAEAGLELIFKDNLLTVASVLDGGPAAKAGIKAGDHILKINAQTVRNLTTQEAARRFHGAPGTSLKLQLLRNGMVKPLDLTVTLGPLEKSTISVQVLKDAFAYVRVKFFTDDTPAELATALKQWQRRQPPLRGVILDLRNNARGTLEQAVRVAAVFLGEKEIVSTQGRPQGTAQTYKGKDRELVFKPPLPMVVLVDQGTARAAEIVAGALADQSLATTLGSKTLGLCGLTKVFPLQDGSALIMSVAQCYTPSGQKIQGKGLEPKVAGQTPPTAEKTAKEPAVPLSLEQDPWVVQAVELLNAGKAPQSASKGAPS